MSALSGSVSRGRRALGVCAVAMAALLGATSCGVAQGETSTILDADTLRIGVKANQPGLGLEVGEGRFEGFDVDVATYVAKELGFSEDDIEWQAVTSDQREKALVDGDVDMIAATYSITPTRKTEVTFAGAYYVAHQDVLVRADENAVDNVRDLKGRNLCQEAGSNSGARVRDGLGVAAKVTEAETYADCIKELAAGDTDAVSTDDLILAGFLGEDPDAFRFVNAPFTDENYGIGLAKGDLGGCEAANKAITKMYQDGTAADLLKKWFGKTDLNVRTSVPQFEGCS
ncbi:amino acid ABC transporter substrate-binding protein (PAAT family) [Murinocardiopsis flavida]|uniref:Amino acid ABC transporter substrate-binding protein (PAAT family) n=1 Tax=Murinocardiopsis flavida TaxID=645275 RepID=A0A2P8DGH5_9ACTN|nr:glutamate ABC transporter substrate-binding protein [Murinocardiopsis flavida]PSK96298.1 amino acid ABC transporter substrate-binding protein (PAAT family) [Murinocardiopsis flavida]